MPSWKKVIVSGSSAHLNQITGSGGVKLTDGVRLNFGDANDMKIYHSGTHSIIQDTGTGNLELKGSIIKLRGTSGGDSMGVFTEDGGVELYYDNSKKLDVVTGGVEVTGNAIVSGNVSGSSTSTGSFGRIHTAGRVGIGTTTLGSTLVVSASFIGDQVRLEGASIPIAYSIYDGSTRKGVIGYATAGDNWLAGAIANDIVLASNTGGMRFGTNGDNARMYISSSGDVQFLGTNQKISGSASSTGSFGHLVIDKDAHIGEDVLADGDVVAYNSSDIRLKDNLQVIKGSLDKIGEISGYEFDWNEKSPGWARERGHDVGVIAQEVQKVVPEIVVERKSGYLGVDYKRLVPLLIESVKELRQEVNDLKKKVN